MQNIIAISLLGFFASSLSIAQDRQLAPNQISVIGSVELKEIANQASFTFSVKGVGSSLRLAVEKANEKVKTVTAKLIEIGVPNENISTSQFYSGENYADKAFLSSSRDYQARLTTLVKVDSIPLLESALYTVSENEVENVSNINFSLRDEFDVRRRARVEAALKAKEKAEDIVRALGASLGRLVSVEEIDPTRVIAPHTGSFYPSPFNPPTPYLRSEVMAQGALVDASRGTGFFAQTIVVTSQLRAIFEIK